MKNPNSLVVLFSLAVFIAIFPLLLSSTTIEAVLVPRFTILAIVMLVIAIAIFFGKTKGGDAWFFLRSLVSFTLFQ